MNLLYGYIVFITIATSYGCEFPSWLQGEWNDTVKGQLSYSSTGMTGWTFQFYQHTISDWECFYTAGDLIVSRSKTTYYFFGLAARPYLCQNFIKVADNVIHYYLMADLYEEEERVYLTPYTQNPENNCSRICSPTSALEINDYYTLTAGDGNANSFPTEVPCNPCTNECEHVGTPLIPTTAPANDSLTFETLPPSYYLNRLKNERIEKNSDTQDDDSNVSGIIGGVVASCLLLCIVFGVAFWLIRRGICVTDVLRTLYEDKNFHAT